MFKFVLIALFFVPFALFIGWLLIVGLGVVKSEKSEQKSPTAYNPNRAYIRWNPRDGWPRGPYLNYECTVCGQSLPSKQKRCQECGCGNLFVGPESLGAKDAAKVRLFEERLDNNPHPENRPFSSG